MERWGFDSGRRPSDVDRRPAPFEHLLQHRRLALRAFVVLLVLAFVLVTWTTDQYSGNFAYDYWEAMDDEDEAAPTQISYVRNASCGWNVPTAVQTVLKDWKDEGITQAQVEHYLRNDSSLAHQCVLIQVLQRPSGHNYVTYGFPWRSYPFIQGSHDYQRLYSLLEMVLSVVERANGAKKFLPALEFSACFGDCVVSQNPKDPYTQAGYRHFSPVYPWIEGPLPVFTSVTCPGSSNIPFIFWDGNSGLDDWERQITRILHNKRKYPWKYRLPKAVFRGGSRTCTIDADEQGRGTNTHFATEERQLKQRCGRHALYHHAHHTTPHKSWFDVHLDGHFLSMSQQERYRYIVYAGGHCQWANRLKMQLFMDNAILFQASQCKEWYGIFLKPWEHYIPVDYHFDNLTEAVQWARDNDDEVQAMIQRKIDYAHCALHKDNMLDYAETLLREYGRLLRYQVWARESTKEFNRHTQAYRIVRVELPGLPKPLPATSRV